MPCYNPLHGWKARSPSDNGGRAIVFNPKKGFIDMPMTVPCGQCIGCRLERSRQWAMRCVHEAQLHDDNCFITLTYNDEHLPKNKSLVKDDFQKFMKRFRKHIAPQKARFFHCGEYGTLNKRPHYHAIIFGFDFPDRVLFSTRGNVRVYTSEILAKLWGKGFVTVGDVTFESAAYVARYILKKVTGRPAADYYNGRLPEYVTMSRRPGVAAGWFYRFWSDIWPVDGTGDYVIMRGKKLRPPKFYDEKLRAELPDYMTVVKRARKVMAALHADETTPERLAVKERIKLAAIDFLVRPL